MKALLLTTALGLAAAATSATADAVRFDLDPSHSQIVFTYDHFGFSTTYGMFSGFEGRIQFDADAPEASSVEVSFPVTTMLTGWEERFQHFMSPDFFAATEDEMVTFVSTGIEVTGKDTALITGDLTLNGVTKAVVLDARLNAAGTNPMTQTEWLGFDATTTLLRSDFGLGLFAPAVSDEVEVRISIEAGIAAQQDARLD
ncbi:YceI family protein [Palleronia sp. KMU-117]|uniref:YceI family protein n=1 Tax=Palleronia sp. KMU-117 TaxID=3434108 RepID=UPI003D735963